MQLGAHVYVESSVAKGHGTAATLEGSGQQQLVVLRRKMVWTHRGQNA